MQSEFLQKHRTPTMVIFHLYALLISFAQSENESDPSLLNIAESRDSNRVNNGLLKRVGIDTSFLSGLMSPTINSDYQVHLPDADTASDPQPIQALPLTKRMTKPPKPPRTFSKSSQYSGWIQAGSIRDLSAFILHPQKQQISKLDDTELRDSLVAFRSHRRIDFNQYSHGYIGGYQTYVSEEKSTSQSNATLYKLSFHSDRTATFQATNHGYYWALDIKEEKIVWTDEESAAIHLEVFVHESSKNVMFLRYKEKFVSFRGSLYSSPNSESLHPHGLTLLSILCENAFFLTPGLPKMNINSYVLARRKESLMERGAFSPIFAPYDIALLLLFDLELTEYKCNTIVAPYEWFNTLFTMTQLIVLNLPEYRTLFPAFGNKLYERLNINALVEYTVVPEHSHWVRDGVLRLYTTATTPVPRYDKSRMEWTGLVGTTVTRAWMRDYDLGYSLLWDSTRISVPRILREFYKYSCLLAELMLPPEMPLNKRLMRLEILYPLGNVEPFLDPDENGEFWFSPFISPLYSSQSLEAMKILPELKLMYYLAQDPRAVHVTVGVGILSVVFQDFLKIFENNSIQALMDYLSLEVVRVMLQALPDLCPSGAIYLVFCMSKTIFSMLATFQNSFVSNMSSRDTTILSDMTLKDLQRMMLQFLDPSLESAKTRLQSQHIQAVREIAGAGNNLSTPAQAKLIALFRDSYDIVRQFFTDKLALFSTEALVARWNEKMKILVSNIHFVSSHTAPAQDQSEPQHSDMGYVRELYGLVSCALMRSNPFHSYISDPVARCTLNEKNLGQTLESLGKLKVANGTDWEELEKLLSRLVNAQESILSFEHALAPFISSETGSLHLHINALEKHAIDYIITITTTDRAISDEEIEKIPLLYSKIVSTFCASSTYSECRELQMETVPALERLCDNHWQALTAVKLLLQITSNTITQSRVYHLTHPRINEEFLSRKEEVYMLHLRTVLGVLIGRAILLRTAVQYCDLEAYERGLRIDSICASAILRHQPISDTQILKLAQKINLPLDESVVNAMLPTQRLFENDGGYVDIEKLMRGERVQFSIPQDLEWLKRMHFVPTDTNDLTKLSVFVKEFHLYLPPRYESFQKKKSRVLVNVRFDGKSIVGAPQPGKRVDIPALSFVNGYEQWPLGYEGTCSSVLLLPHKCMTWPRICSSRTEEEGPVTVMPTLFSPFDAQVVFPDSEFHNSEAKLDYSKTASPMYLDVHLLVATRAQSDRVPPEGIRAVPQFLNAPDGLDADTSESKPSNANPIATVAKSLVSQKYLRNERELAAPIKSVRCCPLGYFMDWLRNACRPCRIGTISQLGGIYCAILETAQSNA